MSITLKQLSELSGLSIRTVSRVLKNQAHVQPAKRDLVLRLAQEHHYIPNMAARNLRLNRSKVVGILSNNLSYEIFTHKLVDLETRLEAQGFYPIVGRYDQSSDGLERMFQDWAGTVDFVVISLFECNPPNLAELFQKYPLTPIYVDGTPPDTNSHSLQINRATGIRNAISELIQHGKKKILRCGSLPSREAGLQEAFQQTPPDRRPKLLLLSSDNSYQAGRTLGPQILEAGADAVFFDTDRQALGFISYATQHHIDIPQALSVIGFDDDQAGSLVYPTLSTVAHPVEELNQAIVDIIRTKPAEPVHKTFPTRFIRRMSF